MDNIAGRYWRLATGFAFAALLCGVLLAGVSAWFLGSVAIAGLTSAALVFNFHAPSAFIRLFAIGRTAARYGERLAGHKAALTDQVERRVRLFSSMAGAPEVLRAGWQLGDEARLADYIDDVEDIDYERLRAQLPALTLGFGIICALAATAWLAPIALLPITALLLATLLASWRTAKADAMGWEIARSCRRRSARRLGAAMASAIPLRAEHAWGRQSTRVQGDMEEAARAALAIRRRQAGVDALASGFGPVACLTVMGGAWFAGWRGADLLGPMFVAFAWLALGETLSGISRIQMARVRRRAAERVMPTGGHRTPRRNAAPRQIRMLSHGGLQCRAPDGRLIGEAEPLVVRSGTPLVLAGPSGSGKTSRLKQIAGWIGDDVLFADNQPLTPGERQTLSTLGLHDAAVLTDTVRANLFANDSSDVALWDALEAVELAERIRLAGGLDAWISQDMLSLGEAQRLNLARCWLSPSPIMLLDEPTEHLDAAQGERLMQRLTQQFSDRILVYSTHLAPRRIG